MSQQTVTINGIVYDAHTGMPLEQTNTDTPPRSAIAPDPQPKKPTYSQNVHQKLQKSQTLNRRAVKKKAPLQAGMQQDIQRHPAISKFAPHPAGIKPAHVDPITPVVPHPIAAKAQRPISQATARQLDAPKPAQTIKQEAINQAIEKAPSHAKNHQQVTKAPRKFSRLLSVGSISIALLILGAYFTYLNMPNLSVRVAAAQAGIDASYPGYHPDGYRLDGAIGYTQGEVNMKFASNSGPQNFTISQKKSSWDSTAVLDNFVKDRAGENYITYSERGLTIYTYGSSAAWVNNGVLYTIDGNAPLSSDQIRHIATSM